MPPRPTAADYSHVTEIPGNRVSEVAVDMARTRYELAVAHCQGRRTLELACGPGVGLRLLRMHARTLVAGDLTFSLLETARRSGAPGSLAQLDAQALPFCDGSFDAVICFEALYFIPDAELAIQECRRVLDVSGVLILAMANPESVAFNPAPHSTRYWTAGDLKALLERNGFAVQLHGGFREHAEGARSRVVAVVKRAAVRLRLIPRTMKGKELLKRIVFGRLVPFPATLAQTNGPATELTPLGGSEPSAAFRVIYAVANRTR